MGQKVHPISYRIGISDYWRSRWFTTKKYAQFIQEDLKVRKLIKLQFKNAGIARVDIERGANTLSVFIHTSKPGVLIGRGGSGITDLKKLLEKKSSGIKTNVEVIEIQEPEVDAYLVTDNIVRQIEQRITYRRAAKQAIEKATQHKIGGIKIIIKGRLGGAEIARTETFSHGKIPLATLRANIDYAEIPAKTTYGTLGVKVWIYKGEIFKEENKTKKLKS